MFKKNRLIASRLLWLASILLSPMVQAEFEYTGQGTLTNKDGQIENFQFGFSFIQQDGEYIFKAGRLSMPVDEVPKRYTLELVQNDKQQVWISDFSKHPLLGFDWKIGEQQLLLTKVAEPSPQAGKYKLTINQTDYFFTSKNRAQVHFKLTSKGIAEIDVDSMMTLKR